MATMEYYTEQLAKANANLDKKQMTLLRYQKALAKHKVRLENAIDKDDRYWIQCDIESKEESIRNTQRTITQLEDRIFSLKEKIAELKAKAASRNVKPLIEFLNNWEQDAIEFYTQRYNEYPAARAEFKAKEQKMDDEIHQMWCNGWSNKKNENYDKYYKAEYERRNLIKQFNSNWKDIEAFAYGADGFDKEMRKAVDREKWRKYDDIIERTVSEIGIITDASQLKVNQRCNLDGIIIGENGAVNVHTIYAGGYHIQCLHVRTLIHKIK